MKHPKTIARLVGGSLPPGERAGHHEEIVDCWHQGLLAGGGTGYSVATLNPVLYSYMFKTGGARGIAWSTAMITRLFSDLLECGRGVGGPVTGLISGH